MWLSLRVLVFIQVILSIDAEERESIHTTHTHTYVYVMLQRRERERKNKREVAKKKLCSCVCGVTREGRARINSHGKAVRACPKSVLSLSPSSFALLGARNENKRVAHERDFLCGQTRVPCMSRAFHCNT